MKFEVGEVCWARSQGVRPGKWIEVEIAQIGFVRYDGAIRDYGVFAGVIDRRTGVDLWGAMEHNLRKKHPPQTDTDIADEQFIKDLNKLPRIEKVLRTERETV